MKISISFLIAILLMSGCVPQQKLKLKNTLLPERLGVKFVNNMRLPAEDLEVYNLETHNFINTYNQSNHKIKLYPTLSDSNSVSINILENEYVTKEKQTAGVLVTLAGIITPIFMLAKNAPFYVYFYYTPKNKTVISSSFSNDLDPKSKTIQNIVKTRHQFQSFDKQKEKQKIAYMGFLYELFNGIEGSENSPFNQIVSNNTSKIVLKDGKGLLSSNQNQK